MVMLNNQRASLWVTPHRRRVLTLLEKAGCSLSSSLSVQSDSVGEGSGETAPSGEEALLTEGEQVLLICSRDSTATEVSLSMVA